MAMLIRKLIETYQYVIYDLSDPRTNDWPLISSPLSLLAVMGLYLHFIYRIGPSIMANRQPFKLDRIIQIYNIIQIVLNAYVLYEGLTIAWLKHYNFRCQPVDYSNEPGPLKIAFTVYLYFGLKLLDLVDTVFFVLRKKQNQISFLHVYHHTGMILGSWISVKYFAGGHGTFIGVINCFVHVVMYTHYLIMSLKIAEPWWKKYITQIQLLQFFLILVHFSQLIWTDCGFPRWTAALFIPQNLFMIVLFGDFYYKAYIKKPKKVEDDKTATNGKIKAQ